MISYEGINISHFLREGVNKETYFLRTCPGVGVSVDMAMDMAMDMATAMAMDMATAMAMDMATVMAVSWIQQQLWTWQKEIFLVTFYNFLTNIEGEITNMFLKAILYTMYLCNKIISRLHHLEHN